MTIMSFLHLYSLMIMPQTPAGSFFAIMLSVLGVLTRNNVMVIHLVMCISKICALDSIGGKGIVL